MKFRSILLVLSLLILAIPSFAQETVEWADYGLEIEISDEWEIDDSGEVAPLAIYNGEYGIFFYTPWEDTEDFEEAAQIILDDDGNEHIEFEDEPIEIEIMGEDALQLPYTSESWSGFLAVFPYDGQVFILDAVIADDRISRREEEFLMEVVQSIRPTEGNNDEPSADAIESAADEDSTGEDIVDELIDLELVSEDGEFLFEEDEVEEGAFDFLESYEGGNIAMGGWLSIELAEDDDDKRFCTFLAQSTTDDPEDDEGTMLIAGFHSFDAILLYEYDLEDSDDLRYEYFDVNVDIEDEQHFLLIIQDDEVMAYLNGELVVDSWELELTAGDDEFFAGFVVGDGCTMSNVWAYSFE